MKILFQGDSITDAGRGDFNSLKNMGSGYVRLVEAALALEEPENEVYNGGISGNRVVDLLARWRRDCLNLKPDVLTVMIGVNDVWHDFILPDYNNGIPTEKFEKYYRILLEETREEIPDIKIILMGAYLVHGTATDERWDTFSKGVEEKRSIAKKLAEELGLEFIDLQRVFEDEQKANPNCCLSEDGVHPTAAGHELIKRAWLEVYNKIKGNC